MKICSKNKNKKQIPKEIKIDLSSLYYKNNKENNQYINTQQTYNSKINNYSNYNKSENKLNNKKIFNIENYNFNNNSEPINKFLDTSNNYYDSIILTTRPNNNKKLLNNFSQKKFLKYNSPQQLFIKNSRINREIEQPSKIKKILSIENFSVNNNNNNYYFFKINFIVYIQKIYKGYKFRKYFKNFILQNKIKNPKNYGKIINLKPSNNKYNKQIYSMKIDIPIFSKKTNIIIKNKNSNYITKNIIINQKYDLKCLIYIQKLYKKYFKIKIIKKLLNNSLQTLSSLNNSKINTPRNNKNINKKNNFNNNKLSEISAIKNTSENNSFISGYNRKCSTNLFFENSYTKTEKEKNDFKEFNKIIKPPKSSNNRIFIQNKIPKRKQLLFRTKNNSAIDLTSFQNETNLNNIIYKKPKSRENSFSKQIEIKNEKNYNINNIYSKNKNIFCHKKFLTNFTQETKCSERYEDSMNLLKNNKNDLGTIQNISHFSIDNDNEQKQNNQNLNENFIEYIIKFIYFIYRNYSNYKNSLIVKKYNNKIFNEINFKYQIIFLIFNLLNEKNFLNLLFFHDLKSFSIIYCKQLNKINLLKIKKLFNLNINDKLNDKNSLVLFNLISNCNNSFNKKLIIKNIENNNNNEKINNKLINEKKLLNKFIFPNENINENIDLNLNNNFKTKEFKLLNNTNIKKNIFKNNDQIIKKSNIKQLNNFFLIDNSSENNLEIYDNIFYIKPLLKNSINIKNTNVKENNIINNNKIFNNLNIKKTNKNIFDKKSIKIRYLKIKGKDNFYLNLDNIFTKKPIKKNFKEINNESCKISIISYNNEKINNLLNESNNNILNYTSKNKFFKNKYINNNIEKENKIEIERKKIMCQPIPKNKFNYNVLLLDIKKKINLIININLYNDINSKFIKEKNKKYNLSNFYYKINEIEDKLNLYN